MIPYNELRIGNYVLVNNVIQRVAMISHGSNLSLMPSIAVETKTEDAERTISLETVQPIVITDDILRECGFAYHEYFKFWQLIKGDNLLRSEMDIDRDYTYIDFMRRPIVKNIKSLHQLQNLYFAFMGTELTFTKAAKPLATSLA